MNRKFPVLLPFLSFNWKQTIPISYTKSIHFDGYINKLEQLKRYGIHCTALLLVNIYLSDRDQYICRMVSNVSQLFYP